MKLNINKILYLIPAFVLALAGCNKQPVLHELNAPADQMKVTPSSTDLILQRADASSEVVTFSWGDATDRGEDTKLTYYFRLYQTADKNNQSELIRMEEGARSISFTTAQLNDLIASWGVLPGDNVSITAQVIAKVSVSYTFMKPETSTTQINVVGYNPANIMYILVGEGDEMLQYQMVSSVADETFFTYKGNIAAGNVRFSYDPKGEEAYYMDGDGKVVLAKEGTSIKNEVLTYNEIELNVKDLTLKRRYAAPYVYIFMVGIENPLLSIPVSDMDEKWYYMEVPASSVPAGAKLYASLDASGANPFVPAADDTFKYITDLESEAFVANRTNRWSDKYCLSVVCNDEEKIIVIRDVFIASETMYPIGDCIDYGGNNWDCGASWNHFNSTGNFFKRENLKYAPELLTVVVGFYPPGAEGFKILTRGDWNPDYNPVGWAPDPYNQWQEMCYEVNDNKWKPYLTGQYRIEMDVCKFRVRVVDL